MPEAMLMPPVEPELARPLNHGRRLMFGTLLMGASNFIKIAVQLITLPLVARLLGPTEYGLYGLAMPAVFLMLMIADSGLGASLARESEANTNVWSSAFWFLIASGIVLMLGLSGASFVFADLAHQPRLPPIMIALSACLIFLVLAVPGNARLTRQGRLGVNSIGEALGNVIGAVVAIVMAWRGAGTWSLVAQTLLTYGIRTCFIMVAAPFRPKFHFAARDLKSHMAMGGSILGTRLADTAGRTAETTLIGRLISTNFVGAYSFANQAPRFICESVSNPLWALLYTHAIRTEDKAASLRGYVLVLRIFGFLVFPAVVLIAAQAHNLVHFLLGDRWLPAVLILQILLVTSALNVVGNLGGALLYAKGRSDIQLRIMIESVILRIAAVALVPWIGITGMAVGFGVVNIFVFLRGMFSVSQFFEVARGPYLRVLAAPAFASAAAGIICWSARNLANGFGWTIADLAFCFLLYCLLLLALEFRGLRDDISALRSLIKNKNG
jgi:PST family polysaccharide transporter